jgi:hypothetical protein
MYGPSHTSFTGATFGYSGNYVVWDRPYAGATGAIGHTTVGTLAGAFFLNREGPWKIAYSLRATGVPSGKPLVAEWRLDSNGSIDGGTQVLQSFSETNIVPATTQSRLYLSKTFGVAVPSGTQLQCFVRVGPSGVKSGGGFLLMTGTDVMIEWLGG